MSGASVVRRMLLCPFRLCITFRANSDEAGIWGECSLCGKRIGYVDRTELRKIGEREGKMTEDLKVYWQGAAAFRVGTERDDNPYDDHTSLDRADWANGWDDAKNRMDFPTTAPRFGDVPLGMDLEDILTSIFAEPQSPADEVLAERQGREKC